MSWELRAADRKSDGVEGRTNVGFRMRSNIRTITLFSMQEKDLVCPNTQYVECSLPQTPGCPTASGRILQYECQHAFLAIPTHNPRRWMYEEEGQSSRCTVMTK